MIPPHILIWVSDMKRAVRFYTEILGLPLIFESNEFSQIGGEKFWIALHISSRSVDERSKFDSPIIVFKTDNVEKDYDKLKQKGIRFYRTPYQAAPAITAAGFMDSEGNELSLSTAD
ncbi:MAG: VOC family protein [Nitrososphaeraceae archaeon]